MVIPQSGWGQQFKYRTIILLLMVLARANPDFYWKLPRKFFLLAFCTSGIKPQPPQFLGRGRVTLWNFWGGGGYNPPNFTQCGGEDVISACGFNDGNDYAPDQAGEGRWLRGGVVKPIGQSVGVEWRAFYPVFLWMHVHVRGVHPRRYIRNPILRNVGSRSRFLNFFLGGLEIRFSTF